MRPFNFRNICPDDFNTAHNIVLPRNLAADMDLLFSLPTTDDTRLSLRE